MDLVNSKDEDIVLYVVHCLPYKLIQQNKRYRIAYISESEHNTPMVKFTGINGLNDEEVKASRSKQGNNELPAIEVESFLDKLKGNFEDPLIRILLLALGITLFLALLGYAELIEGVGIAIAVFLATFVSTYSEYSNEAEFRKLQEDASKVKSNVFRNSTLIILDAADIVVGDVVLLQAGDMIPADGILIHGTSLEVNQVTLTGEPVPVVKRVASKQYTFNDDFYDNCACFRGTVVEDGEAVLQVDRVGTNTSFGKIYADLHEDEERDSPLKGEQLAPSYWPHSPLFQ